MLFVVLCVGSLFAQAQCLSFQSLLDVYAADVSTIDKSLTDAQWKENQPDVKKNFKRSLKSWSVDNQTGPICWLDYYYTANTQPIVSYMMLSNENYSQIKNDLKAAGAQHRKTKAGNDDMFLAYELNGKMFVLNKYNYNHSIKMSSYDLIICSLSDFDMVWKEVTK